MSKFSLYENGRLAGFLIEKESFDGIKQIGETVAQDVELVTGVKPEIIDDLKEFDGDLSGNSKNVGQNSDLNYFGENLVLMATIGKSAILERLVSDRKLSLSEIEGKREVYLLAVVENPFPDHKGVKKLLVIAGSDKRGTIYGMFRLSEMCGVSPLVFFGDAAPDKKSELIFEFDEPVVSKEPSVKYRGFFINDEWPAFGNWCTEKYGDVNAKAYEKIFELLLRLKGNYMWPAMWNSSFSEDGPGILNAELADKLGVIMGLSHHEPMCRSGVEWQRQYKNYSDDNTWSFLSNEKGIRKFWEDGVTRNRPFENVITIGMRGEADSKLMPEDATLEDNINVIKKAITAQHEIIKDKVNPELKEVPRMLAIYKEVEDYYFGDESCEGLKDWDEIKDVIFLLSDDNHGNVRALPTKETAGHPGGFGMYYHFDYHGAPVSYEWVNCNRLTKTWEQMSLAYEAGVREMWIVNVGDLKLNEYPLSFFMEMAYDYEPWSESALLNSDDLCAEAKDEKSSVVEIQHQTFKAQKNGEHFSKIENFVYKWIDVQFGESVSPAQKKDIFKVLTGYTKWNSMRTPETMNEMVYEPVNFMEGDRVWVEVNDLLKTANRLNEELPDAALTAYRSMIYYPAAASFNIVLMSVEAGMNRELAMRGCVFANHFARTVQNRIADDKKYVADFHAFNGGKWNHMMSSAHIGFRSWDAYNWSYPVTMVVTPLHEAKAVVSFRDSRRFDLGSHWQGTPPLRSDAFTRPDTEVVLLDIDSRGEIGFSYEVETDCEWLECTDRTGKVEILSLDQLSENINENSLDAAPGEGRKTLKFKAGRTRISGASEGKARIRITFDDGTVSTTELLFEAIGDIKDIVGEIMPATNNLFVESQGIISINAEHFCEKKDSPLS